MKITLVHDWLPVFCGAEKVLYALYEMYSPSIHTLIHDNNNHETDLFKGVDIRTSFIQNMPFGVEKYRFYLPLFPYAIEQFDLNEYDVVLSNSNAVAKGVLTNYRQLHICYCHTPMRYCWDLYSQYFNSCSENPIVKHLAKILLHYLRIWDISNSIRVDHFIAISKHVEKRIMKTYGRTCSDVIYPPVDVDSFEMCETDDGYYITVSRLVPYKRVDLLVKAFNSMKKRKLIVIGAGPELEHIKKIAGPNIELLGYQNQEKMRTYMKNAKAFVFAGEEDFGITMVEAQASGIPVIAFGRGGATETVINYETGLYFNEQNIKSIIEAVNHFESIRDQFVPSEIRKHSEKFNTQRFKDEIGKFVDKAYLEFTADNKR